jgi:hypothetical protein
MKKLLIIGIMLILANNSLAIQGMNKGDIAKEDGFFLTKPEETKIRYDRESNKHKITKLEDLRVQDKRLLKNYKEYNSVLNTQYNDIIKAKRSSISPTLAFILGSLTASLLGIGVYKAIK